MAAFSVSWNESAPNTLAGSAGGSQHGRCKNCKNSSFHRNLLCNEIIARILRTIIFYHIILLISRKTSGHAVENSGFYVSFL